MLAVLIVDLIVAGLIAVMAFWGFSRGLTVGTLALAGFGAGAVLGSRLAPLILHGGQSSTYAPEVALPGALLLGAVVAAVVERIGLRLHLHRRLDRLGAASPIAGALLGGCLGLVAAWLLGAVAIQVGSPGNQVRRSAILGRLDALLPPPGPAPAPAPKVAVSLPTFEGPPPAVGPADPRVTSSPGVRRAARSVVEIGVSGCGQAGIGSGWIAADGVVVTAGHVVVAGHAFRVRFKVGGETYPATPIWFDPRNDVGILRVPGVKGVPALPLVRGPRDGTPAAVLGFPLGRWKVRPARLGATSSTYVGHLSAGEPIGVSGNLYGRLITSFAGLGEPGNSGGPLVDGRGRVLTTVFGGPSAGRQYGYGVANAVVRSALRRAGPRVGTGPCP
ncbi:MAG: CvpA family protein [Actinomycetota bacterium]|nr:CvpA family protein [Actinomycetota bacterium]